jgi:hypothetical protein
MSTFAVVCPSCDEQLEADESLIGVRVKCPSCDFAFEITAAHGAEDGPPQETTGGDAPPDDSEPVQEEHTSYPDTGQSFTSARRDRTASKRRPPSTSRINAPDLSSDWATGRPTPEDLDIPKYVWLPDGEHCLHQYHVRKRVPQFRVVIFVVALMAFVLPALIYLLWLWLAPRAHGIIAITNRRFLYIEYGTGLFSKSFHVTSMDVSDIAAVDCFTQHGIEKFLGIFISREKKAFLLRIQSRYPAQFTIGGITAVTSSMFEPASGAVSAVQQIGAQLADLRTTLTRGQS